MVCWGWLLMTALRSAVAPGHYGDGGECRAGRSVGSIDLWCRSRPDPLDATPALKDQWKRGLVNLTRCLTRARTKGNKTIVCQSAFMKIYQ